ncbi:hypothetical protein [Nonomuraea bangladeshensis]|uniref:hypothetical protein n=1 Tax=Nonomuraea bangladeshensis TaxID=404385 RepID=UPI0031E06F43
MDRETLVQLLATAGEAGHACRQALAADAYFEIWPELVETLPLIRTYQRRARLTRRKNVPPLGFDEAVTQLEACELQHLILGIVRSTEPAYHFQLFLSPDASRVVACLGCQLQPPVAHRSPEHPQEVAVGRLITSAEGVQAPLTFSRGH